MNRLIIRYNEIIAGNFFRHARKPLKHQIVPVMLNRHCVSVCVCCVSVVHMRLIVKLDHG